MTAFGDLDAAKARMCQEKANRRTMRPPATSAAEAKIQKEAP